ncbi:hypothetical protein CYCD_19070 [Tenuifilaceae bacterium CYCD]|nr:hypothetical protein CYCD_19070 [Tenuifilaceae bacterium CYCD]
MRLVVFTLLFLGGTLWNTVLSQVERNMDSPCKIIRYITDIRNVDEDVKEISVNMLFQINESGESGNFRYMVPDAEKVLVTNYSVRIFDGNGELIYKNKRRKVALNELQSFNPRAAVSKYLDHPKPLNIEWDYKLVVYSPKGVFEWPSISGTYNLIDEASLRLSYENSEDFEFTTNIEVSSDKDLTLGNYYYLWSIKKLTKSSGEFNGMNVTSPYVRFVFN